MLFVKMKGENKFVLGSPKLKRNKRGTTDLSLQRRYPKTPKRISCFQAILVLAQLDFVIGTIVPPSEEKKAKGFTGYSMENYKENLFSAYTFDARTGGLHTFFSVFAIYFPSCTGIVAGANLSGDLQDPAGAIPKGTLLAVGTTYFSYILYAILSAGKTCLH